MGIAFPIFKSRSKIGLLKLGLIKRRGVFTYQKTNTRLLPRLSEIEDRRSWNPAKPDFKILTGSPVRYAIPKKYTTKKSLSKPFLTAAIGFSNPTATLVCIRRKMRKEVLHAKGVAGGHVRPPKFTESSYIQC